MKGKIGAYMVCLILTMLSCQEAVRPSDLTGNEAIYSLRPGPDYGLSGTVTFQEKKDHSTLITITLLKTDRNIHLPAHLHLGSLSESDAEIAVLLNSVAGSTGVSTTTVTSLTDERRITYKDMIRLEACIKVHLSDIGAEKDILLAGGNVGNIATKIENGEEFGICKSE